MRHVRVLLADSEPRVRYALRVLLEQSPSTSVEGLAADAAELRTMLATARPDVIIVDWSLSGLEESGSIRALRRACPTAKVIVLSSRPECRQAALSAGADEFISKVEPPERLLQVLFDKGKQTANS